MYLNKLNFILRAVYVLLEKGETIDVVFEFLKILTVKELHFVLILLKRDLVCTNRFLLLFSEIFIDNKFSEDLQLNWTNIRKKFKKNLNLINVRKFRRNNSLTVWLPAFRFKIFSNLYSGNLITMFELLYRKNFFFLKEFFNEINYLNYFLQKFYSKVFESQGLNFDCDTEPDFIKLFYNETLIQKKFELVVLSTVDWNNWKINDIFKSYNKRFLKKRVLQIKLNSKNVGLDFGGSFYKSFHEKLKNPAVWADKFSSKNFNIVCLKKMVELLHKNNLTYKLMEFAYRDLSQWKKTLKFEWEYLVENVHLIHKYILMFKHGLTIVSVQRIEEKLNNVSLLVGEKQKLVWNLVYKETEILLTKMLLKRLKLLKNVNRN